MGLTAFGVGAISSLLGAGAQAYGAGLARKSAKQKKDDLQGQLPGFRKAYEKENYFVDKSAYRLADQANLLAEETKRRGLEQAQRGEGQIAAALRSGDSRLAGAMSPALRGIQEGSAQIAAEANKSALAGKSALAEEISRINTLNKQKSIDLAGRDLFGTQEKIDTYQYAQDASRQAIFDALGGAATNVGALALTSIGNEGGKGNDPLRIFTNS